MMKFFLRYIVEVIIILALITQIIYPLFVPKVKFFWIFSRNKSSESVSTLSELSKEAEEASTKMKGVKEKIDDAQNDLDNIKSNL